MSWVIVLLALALVLGVALWTFVSPLRVLVGLVATGALVSVAFVVLAVATSTDASRPTAGFSHEQLEADRVMTQQMATSVGSGMDSVMINDGMLARSGNVAYLRALEQHTRDVDRMLGRVP
jgi:hypothetical protein